MSRVSVAMASDARRRGAANSSYYSQAAQQRRWGHCGETRRDGAFRAICCVAPLANGGLPLASRRFVHLTRKASVATTRGLRRGSLIEEETCTCEMARSLLQR